MGWNPTGAWKFVCCECYVLSGRGLCDELITRLEESYRLWCVVACDLETSRLGRPWRALGLSATGKRNHHPEYLCSYSPSHSCSSTAPLHVLPTLVSPLKFSHLPLYVLKFLNFFSSEDLGLPNQFLYSAPWLILISFQKFIFRYLLVRFSKSVIGILLISASIIF